LLNHSKEPNCEWGYNEENACFYLIAIKPIERDEELTIKYGNICNLNLFVNYGVSLMKNPESSGITLRYEIKEVAETISGYFKDDSMKKKFVQICLRLKFGEIQKDAETEGDKNLVFRMFGIDPEREIVNAVRRVLKEIFETIVYKRSHK
jgi:hypothetical protein